MGAPLQVPQDAARGRYTFASIILGATLVGLSGAPFLQGPKHVTTGTCQLHGPIVVLPVVVVLAALLIKAKRVYDLLCTPARGLRQPADAHTDARLVRVLAAAIGGVLLYLAFWIFFVGLEAVRMKRRLVS